MVLVCVASQQPASRFDFGEKFLAIIEMIRFVQAVYMRVRVTTAVKTWLFRMTSWYHVEGNRFDARMMHDIFVIETS